MAHPRSAAGEPEGGVLRAGSLIITVGGDTCSISATSTQKIDFLLRTILDRGTISMALIQRFLSNLVPMSTLPM